MTQAKLFKINFLDAAAAFLKKIFKLCFCHFHRLLKYDWDYENYCKTDSPIGSVILSRCNRKFVLKSGPQFGHRFLREMFNLFLETGVLLFLLCPRPVGCIVFCRVAAQ